MMVTIRLEVGFSSGNPLIQIGLSSAMFDSIDGIPGHISQDRPGLGDLGFFFENWGHIVVQPFIFVDGIYREIWIWKDIAWGLQSLLRSSAILRAIKPTS